MAQKNINMPITKARVNLGSVVERVRTTNEQVTLEKGGIPVAALVNIETLEDLRDAIDLFVAREESRSEPFIKWSDIRAKYV